jgi:NADPH:quinone reductase-like Zn-dependent oxidoreductase
VRITRLIDRGLENLRVEEVPEPTPGEGQILIELRAASLNFRDLSVIFGPYPARLPLVPLSDGVGIVKRVGENVTRVQVGDRVCPIYAPEWISGTPDRDFLARALGGGIDGVLRDQMVVDQRAVVKVPAHLTDEEAACLPVAGVTAWSALRAAQLTASDTVLIQGTGGVSLFALQLAKASGARVIALVSSAERARRATALGADVTVDRSVNDDWPKDVLAATGGQGVDVVVEVGGAESLPKSVQALRLGGRVSCVGLASGAMASLPLQAFMPKMASLHGIVVGSRDSFEELNRVMERHALRPVIDRVFPRDQFAQAVKHFKESRQFGKVVLRY